MAEWFYAIDDQEGGPITSQELKQLADTGKLKPTDQVWKEGFAEWVAAGSLKNLCPTPAATKPAAPAPLKRAEPLPEDPPPAKIIVPTTEPIGRAAPPGSAKTEIVSTPAKEAEAWKPAVEHKLEAGSDDEDLMELEAPIERPTEEQIAPKMTERLKKEAAAKSPEKEYLDYNEAFELGDQAKKVATEASRDAVAAFQTMLKNPVGGLDEAFAFLGPNRALGVGIVFMVAFAAAFFVGVQLLNATTVQALFGIPHGEGFVNFIKICVLAPLSPLGMLAGCAATRAMFKGQGGIQSDGFLSGAALLPLGVFALVAGPLEKFDSLVTIAGVFAFTTTALMLYSGQTRINKTPETAATIAVPIILLLCFFIPRLVAATMY